MSFDRIAHSSIFMSNLQRVRTSSANMPLPDLPETEAKPERPNTMMSDESEAQPTEDEEEEEEEDFDFDERDRPVWDMFQLIPRDRISPSESFEGMLKGLRLFMYMFLFLIVWISATASVGCFLLLVGSASKGYADVSMMYTTHA